jgi:choline kinase
MDHMSGAEVIKSRKDVSQERVEKLDYEVKAWSPACSVFWALWGIIQAGEQVSNILTGDGAGVEFDYLVSTVVDDQSWFRAETQSYAMEKLDTFRKDIKDLGVAI